MDTNKIKEHLEQQFPGYDVEGIANKTNDIIAENISKGGSHGMSWEEVNTRIKEKLTPDEIAYLSTMYITRLAEEFVQANPAVAGMIQKVYKQQDKSTNNN